MRASCCSTSRPRCWGPRDVERLVRCLRDLAANGVAVGLVTHRISEVLGTADKVTVLRGGYIVHRGAATGLTTDTVARLMIGERSLALTKRDSTKRDAVRLSAKSITLVDDGFTILDGIDLSVAAGEILGIAGVAGAAQPALASVLAGIRKPTLGRVTFDGADITGAARRANLMGLAHIPDDRNAGVVAEQSVAVNASLLQLTTRAFRRVGLRRPTPRTTAGCRDLPPFRCPPAAARPAGRWFVGRQSTETTAGSGVGPRAQCDRCAQSNARPRPGGHRGRP